MEDWYQQIILLKKMMTVDIDRLWWKTHKRTHRHCTVYCTYPFHWSFLASRGKHRSTGYCVKCEALQRHYYKLRLTELMYIMWAKNWVGGALLILTPQHSQDLGQLCYYSHPYIIRTPRHKVARLLTVLSAWNQYPDGYRDHRPGFWKTSQSGGRWWSETVT